jgi:GDP-4-dehydro-6-deoxy-D-mannose reductase
MSHKTIVITGATGFVGQGLAVWLKKRHPDYKIIGIVRKDISSLDGYDSVYQCRFAVASLQRLLKDLQPDCVLHLAAFSYVGQNIKPDFNVFKNNLDISIAMAEAMAESCQGVPLIFASSGEVYGTAFNLHNPIAESAVPDPQNPYARSKLASEFAFRDILTPFSPVIALRLFNHFGAKQNDKFVIPSFAKQIANCERRDDIQTMQVGNLSNSRDFLSVHSVYAAYEAAINLSFSLGKEMHIYNICSGDAHKIEDIMHKLLSFSRKKLAVEQSNALLRGVEIKIAAGDFTAFQAKTGWKPFNDFDSTLLEVLNHWRI